LAARARGDSLQSNRPLAHRIVGVLRAILPRKIFDRVYLLGVRSYKIFVVPIYAMIGRPANLLETSKARPRREAEGFFETYCKGNGIDIGFGGDLLVENCRGWDLEDGDAQLMEGVSDESYDFVYSSHTLEHLPDPELALANWWRIIKPGGHLIVCVPHRDLYEKKKTLPSRWNLDHKHFFMPEADEPPDTIGVTSLIKRVVPDGDIIYVKECDQGHTITDPETHSDGEYSVEAIVQKPERVKRGDA
jgi:SAM-dependent methyltransferase